MHNRAASAILWGGLIAGILDISSAFVLWGVKGVAPTRVLQGIASAFHGPSSFQGGLTTASAGLAAHFLIAFTAAAVFSLAAVRLPALAEFPFVAGPLYGIGVWMVMYLLVLPLSGMHPKHTVPSVATQVIFCVGLPIALSARRALLGVVKTQRLNAVITTDAFDS
jgi:uncharacterized membrane protein YagU involved in acid resistance